ncbi:MAG: conjugal transfer protein TraG N-terminal domain-containing protein, partial [Sideroxyarcus sp.]|nr:conjugal transfer protein TraG N-terminal domain-containing protein [Sideroxyarcus sp.]
MSLTIYTLGDIPTFVAILNAVAMVFQTGMMTGPGLGLGAAAGVGLLVSVGVMLLAGGAIAMFKGGGGMGNWPVLLVLIVVYSVATQPVALQIEDYYTGTATAVSNMPFGVAVPGAIISSVTRSVADKMETGFSTVDGNYISLSSDGFASPLQLMLSMRGGKYGLPDADPFLTANIKVFVLDCVAGNAGFDADAFAKQNIPGVSNPIAYITQPGVYRTGLTVIFSKANPAGIGSACIDAAINIQNGMNAFVAPGAAAPIAGYLNANMNKKASPNTAMPNKYSADDLVALHGKMIN